MLCKMIRASDISPNLDALLRIVPSSVCRCAAMSDFSANTFSLSTSTPTRMTDPSSVSVCRSV